MIRRLVIVTCWLLLGHAVLAGLYYWLLNVPESSVWMLGTSAMLGIAIVALGLYVYAVGIAGWLPDRTAARGIARAGRHVGSLLPPIVLLGLALWAGARADAWHAAHRGEIDAALMARFNQAETAWVHTTWYWLLFTLKYAVALSLALAWVVSGMTGGLRGLAAPRWVLRGLDPRAWGSILAAELVLITLPWRFVFWRPASLPATRAEVLFVGAKLAVIAVAAAIGWAIVLGIPVWRAMRPGAPPAAPSGSASSTQSLPPSPSDGPAAA